MSVRRWMDLWSMCIKDFDSEVKKEKNGQNWGLPGKRRQSAPCVFSFTGNLGRGKEGCEVKWETPRCRRGRETRDSERRGHVIEGRYTCEWKWQRETPHFIQLTYTTMIWNKQKHYCDKSFHLGSCESSSWDTQDAEDRYRLSPCSWGA